MTAVCDDLRLGGTLSPTGISGGTTINRTGLAVSDWSGVFGHGGISYTPVEVAGRPGGYVVGDSLPKHRFPTLNMAVGDWPADCEAPGEPDGQLLWDNTDIFLALLTRPTGNYLEVDLPDGSSRFLHVYAIDPAPIAQPRTIRSMSVPLYSPHQYWKAGGAQSSDTISGSDTLVVGGTVNVYDPVLTFAGNGTLQHSDLDWQLDIAGASGPVTVDLGARTVTQAGVAADQLLNPSNRLWGWFTPGSNTVLSSVAVTVTWRNQYA